MNPLNWFRRKKVYCVQCGRLLFSKASKAKGMGAACARKASASPDPRQIKMEFEGGN